MKGASGTPSYVMLTLNTIKLTIKPNGQFWLQDMGVPKEGRVSVDGDKALLNITKIAGVDAGRQSVATQESIAPIELKAMPDATLIYNDPKNSDPAPIQLKRIATPVADRP
jgi:hypothetical protein